MILIHNCCRRRPIRSSSWSSTWPHRAYSSDGSSSWPTPPRTWPHLTTPPLLQIHSVARRSTATTGDTVTATTRGYCAITTQSTASRHAGRHHCSTAKRTTQLSSLSMTRMRLTTSRYVKHQVYTSTSLSR